MGLFETPEMPPSNRFVAETRVLRALGNRVNDPMRRLRLVNGRISWIRENRSRYRPRVSSSVIELQPSRRMVQKSTIAEHVVVGESDDPIRARESYETSDVQIDKANREQWAKTG